jgi:hypothetical protein
VKENDEPTTMRSGGRAVDCVWCRARFSELPELLDHVVERHLSGLDAA